MTEKEKRPVSERGVKALAVFGLLFVTIIWGSTFVVTKNSMDVFTPLYLIACRFTPAAIGLSLVFFGRVRTMTGKDIKYGSILGFFLFVSFFFQTYGLKYTTASKNAFITTLYVIIVPFLHWLLNRVKPAKNTMIAAVIAVAGLALISLRGDRSVNAGDLLSFVGGLCFALHMVCIDRYTMMYDPVRLTVVQMISCAVYSWIAALLLEPPMALSVFEVPGVIVSVLYLGTVASMLCFLVQTVGQKYLSPNTTSILLSFESVFGLIFSIMFLSEKITPRMFLGCALMFTAAILAEYRPARRKNGPGLDAGRDK